MNLSVMIPTYRRPKNLEECLNGLNRQQRAADQIIVIVRQGDEETHAVLAAWTARLPIVSVAVDRPGQIHALNTGLARVTGDIVTITDDDAIAHPDWLRRIENHFARDPALGGVGGRDIVHAGGVTIPPSARHVGLILPFGRFIGNHHIGRGAPRLVHHIKGVNMSWRIAAVGPQRFDPDLRGDGAQVYNDLAFSLALRLRGWSLLYDPAITVDHYPAPCFDRDQRGATDLKALENSSFNFYLLLRRYLPSGWRQRAALCWAFCIGTPKRPGSLLGLLSRLRNDRNGMDLRQTALRAWQAARAAAIK